MENINIPIYRAKKIDSDEHIQGFYEGWENKHFIVISPREYSEIDATTLAITFPDMLDSQGNKIFASLNEDGKGGDILEYSRLTNKMWYEGKKKQIKTTLCKFNTRGLNILSILKANGNDAFKVIGIQK